MPGDLVGKLGIRFDYASQGLTGLMGIQVDPYFGWGHEDERLYIRVANLGNETVLIQPGADVFTFELHIVEGNVPPPLTPRLSMWHRLLEILTGQSHISWSSVTSVQQTVKDTQQQVTSAREEIRDYLQPLVMFGVFLVAVTILGAALSVILSMRNTPEVQVPSWVTNWGWWLLLITLSIASVATAVMGGLAAFQRTATLVESPGRGVRMLRRTHTLKSMVSESRSASTLALPFVLTWRHSSNPLRIACSHSPSVQHLTSRCAVMSLMVRRSSWSTPSAPLRKSRRYA